MERNTIEDTKSNKIIITIEKLRVVILSIVEGDCERWALLATMKTGFGAYWHHRCREQLFF